MLQFYERGYCTYCSAPKRDTAGEIPAVERYQSERIARLAETARREGCPMWIVSGRYGLLEPNTPIPWYDKLLLDEDVEGLVSVCAESLERAGVKRLMYHTASLDLAPEVTAYLRLVRLACKAVSVELEVVTLPGVPV